MFFFFFFYELFSTACFDSKRIVKELILYTISQTLWSTNLFSLVQEGIRIRRLLENFKLFLFYLNTHCTKKFNIISLFRFTVHVYTARTARQQSAVIFKHTSRASVAFDNMYRSAGIFEDTFWSKTPETLLQTRDRTLRMCDQLPQGFYLHEKMQHRKMYIQIHLRVGMTRLNKIKQYKQFFTCNPLTMLLHGPSFLIQSFSDEKPSSLVASFRLDKII